MNNFMNKANALMLATSENALPTWVVSSFPIIKIVLFVLIAICSIFMIVAILSQRGEANGNTITGQTDTFYNRNKGTSLQGIIKKLTVIDAILLVVFCLAFLVLNSIYTGTV